MRRPALLALCLAVLAPTVWSEAQAQTRSPIDSSTRWTLAAVGDVIMNRRTAPFDHPGDPGFHELANWSYPGGLKRSTQRSWRRPHMVSASRGFVEGGH